VFNFFCKILINNIFYKYINKYYSLKSNRIKTQYAKQTNKTYLKMIEDIVNINVIFYISFVSLIIKMFKNSTMTDEDLAKEKTRLCEKKEKKDQLTKNKFKRKDHRLKRRQYRRALRKERNGNGNDTDETDDSNDSNDSLNDSLNEKVNNKKLKATSNTLSVEEKMQLIDTSLWDEN